MRKADVLIILSVIAVSVGGSLVTGNNMGWYDSLTLPEGTPPGSAIGTMWTVIFVLTGWVALRAWRTVPEGLERRKVFVAFGINAVLNVLWSYIFFGLHLLGWATVEAAVLAMSVFTIMTLLWRHDRFSVVLLAPYFLWVSFATFLAYQIWQLN